jgi:arsenite-transporting ATPase
VALKPRQVIGLEALRRFFEAEPLPDTYEPPRVARTLPGFDELVAALADQRRGAIMLMGKGGVGKTTLAARIAVALAARGIPVHLTTTDPAAHIRAAVGDLPRGLTIGEIDPRVEVARYRAEVMETTGAKLDAAGRALLEEDLSSPCTEEVAVFQAFARVMARANDEVVVIDTAPTGHTILLLDAAQAFHREVMRQARSVSEAVRELLPRLRERSFTRILLCTLAESTPVHEAAALQADLRRAGIEPHAWIVNQSLTPLAPSDPLLAARRVQEARHIEEVVGTHAATAYIVAWQERLAQPRARVTLAA